MDAVTAFERQQDALRERLAQAKDMPDAVRAATMALERVAAELMRGEQDELARQRQQAVLAVARRAPQLLRAATAEGELRVRPAQGKAGRRVGAAGWAGAFLLAALAVALLIDGKPLFAALQGLGAGLAFFGFGMREAARDEIGAVGVLGVDADALVLAVRELCAAADVCAQDLALLEGGASGVDGAQDDATLDLLASLLEAGQTGRGDVALESLSQVGQRLAQWGIEAVLYDREHAALFDLLPTLGEERTVRPALVKDGKVLRRGVAVCRMERSVSA